MTEMTRGQTVYTKELISKSTSRGSLNRKQYGSYTVLRKSAVTLGISKARYQYKCTCGNVIEKGDLHGSDFYMHKCLECVTAEKPKSVIKPL